MQLMKGWVREDFRKRGRVQAALRCASIGFGINYERIHVNGVGGEGGRWFWTWHEPNHSKAEPSELEQMYKKTRGRWQPAPGTAAGETCCLTEVHMRLKSLWIPPIALPPPPKKKHKGDICRFKLDSKKFVMIHICFLYERFWKRIWAFLQPPWRELTGTSIFIAVSFQDCAIIAVCPPWKELKCRERSNCLHALNHRLNVPQTRQGCHLIKTTACKWSAGAL